MIFEFPANEFGPRALGDVWMLFRSLAWDQTGVLEITESKEGVVRLEVRLEKVDEKYRLMTDLVPLLLRLGGKLVEDQQVVRLSFLPGTFDPSEVLVRIDDFVTVSKRISKTSEPIVELKWTQEGSLKMKVKMEVGVYENVFLKFHYDKVLSDLSAIFE